MKIGQDLSIHLIVQSNHKTPDFLNERVEHFLVSFRETLADMSLDQLSTFIQAVKEKLTEKPKNILSVNTSIFHSSDNDCNRSPTNIGTRSRADSTCSTGRNCWLKCWTRGWYLWICWGRCSMCFWRLTRRGGSSPVSSTGRGPSTDRSQLEVCWSATPPSSRGPWSWSLCRCSVLQGSRSSRNRLAHFNFNMICCFLITTLTACYLSLNNE